MYEVVNGQQVLLGTVNGSTTSVNVTGLTPGSSTSFEVEAFNATSSADSNVVAVTTQAPQVSTVSAPQVTAQALSATSVQLTWNADPAAQGFSVFWSNGYQLIYLGTVSGSTTSVTINGLRPGSHSYFLVEAFNSVSRANSQWVEVTTPSLLRLRRFRLLCRNAIERRRRSKRRRHGLRSGRPLRRQPLGTLLLSLSDCR